MPHITLSEEQANLVANSCNGVEICDSSGRVLGYIDPPLPPEEIEIVKARMKSRRPGYSIEQVLAHLESLNGKNETIPG